MVGKYFAPIEPTPQILTAARNQNRYRKKTKSFGPKVRSSVLTKKAGTITGYSSCRAWPLFSPPRFSEALSWSVSLSFGI
jgi:hypothetical protein